MLFAAAELLVISITLLHLPSATNRRVDNLVFTVRNGLLLLLIMIIKVISDVAGICCEEGQS